MTREFHCCVPGCHSLCILSPLDRDRIDAALTERGWTTKGDKRYCPVHKSEAEKPDAEPVPPTD